MVSWKTQWTAWEFCNVHDVTKDLPNSLTDSQPYTQDVTTDSPNSLILSATTCIRDSSNCYTQLIHFKDLLNSTAYLQPDQSMRVIKVLAYCLTDLIDTRIHVVKDLLNGRFATIHDVNNTHGTVPQICHYILFYTRTRRTRCHQGHTEKFGRFVTTHQVISTHRTLWQIRHQTWFPSGSGSGHHQRDIGDIAWKSWKPSTLKKTRKWMIRVQIINGNKRSDRNADRI